MKVRQIIAVFERCFTEQYATRLCGGAEEPLYLPKQGATLARLHFRSDYAASALHEVAHWCLAGTERRRCVFAFWDGVMREKTHLRISMPRWIKNITK